MARSKRMRFPVQSLQSQREQLMGEIRELEAAAIGQS